MTTRTPRFHTPRRNLCGVHHSNEILQVLVGPAEVPLAWHTPRIWKLAFSWGSFELPGGSWGPPNPLGTFGPESVCSLYKFCARTRRRAGWGLLELITELASVTEPQAAWDSFGPPGISLGAHLNCLGPPGVHQSPWARLGLKAYSAPERAAERAGVRARCCERRT